MDPSSPLADLVYHWGDAYVVAHPEPDVWVAVRRDTRETLHADTPDGLRAAMNLDYLAKPVPRDGGAP